MAMTVLAAVVAVVLGFVPLRRLHRRSGEPEPEAPEEATDISEAADDTDSEEASAPAPASAAAPFSGPKASVVVTAYNDKEIDEFLESVTSQDYPDYEVIIVHEATQMANDEIAGRYASFDRVPVKFCFYPPGSHALSQTKLALTIGIKAAAGDVIVTTTSRCRIPSRRWLSSLMRNFTPGVDIVLGYAATDFDELPRGKRPLRRFVSLMTSAQWMSAAAAGRPYRGDGMNLAYRRQLFFDVKGFSQTMELVNGEDDLFIAPLASADNTRLEFSDDAVVTPCWGDEASRLFDNARDRYRFTSAMLPRRAFLEAGAASLCQWLMLGAAIIAALVDLPNLVPAIVALILLIAAMVTEALIYRRGAAVLGDSRKWWLSPLLLLARPFDNAFFGMSRRRQRDANYTYRRR